MNQKLLSLTPKRFLCPYCGKWHEWDTEHSLKYHDSAGFSAEFECSNAPVYCRKGNYEIYFHNDYCYISTINMCSRAYLSIRKEIPISSLIESTDEPIVTFEVPFTTNNDVGREECSDCDYRDECNCVKLGDEGDHRHMNITLGFEFEQSEYDNIVKLENLARKEREQPQSKEKKEDATMANNNLNMNMEIGPNKDENIASTIMGVAVKNGDNWRIYDKKKKEITDVGDMSLGNFPIYILPTTKLNEGDLIKDAGEYYFVTEVATSNTPTQTLSARTGEIKNVVPIKNILGISCYSKVIALSDSLDMSDDDDVEKMVIMSALCGQTGEEGKGDDQTDENAKGTGQINQLLPLLLFKDKLGGDDDEKLLIMSSMMTQQNGGNQANQFIPLLLFKDKLGGDDDAKLLLMSSMMNGGNTADPNKQLMNYLILNKFIGGKKKDKEPQEAGKVSAKDEEPQEVGEVNTK